MEVSYVGEDTHSPHFLQSKYFKRKSVPLALNKHEFNL